jgi:predicted ribosomally synthesized peptide with SipW-like signal peptide
VKRTLYIYVAIALLCAATAGATYAAFSDRGKYLGSKFMVASADLKLLNDLTQGTTPSNLLDEKPGPVFDNIGPGTKVDYPIKMWNSGSSSVNVASNANYETANDPAELRQVILAEILEWNDANSNGVAEAEEIGVSLGNKTIVKWKTEGIPIGVLTVGEIKGYILRFSAPTTLSSTLQGATGIFDFEFTSTNI